MGQPLGQAERVLFAAVALLTGVVGVAMFFFPVFGGQRLWPWLLTPLVSRFLGALFIAVAVGAVFAARTRYWQEVRALFPPALTFTGLALIASLLYLPSFKHPILERLYFLVYVVVFVAGLVVYLRYERRLPTAPP
jgi:peptidoglycan/LPS O-acetylase OafA/YrhL